MTDPEKHLGEIAVAKSWTLPGVGPYGSDVEVVSRDVYENLAQRCRNAEAAALIWGRKALLLEQGHVSELADDEVLRALRLPVNALSKKGDVVSVAGYWTSGLSTPVYFDHTEQQREKALADAPGLTIDAIDHLLREAYVKGHGAGRAEGYIAGRKDARPHVEAEISNQMRSEIKRIVGGQLIHIARRLNDRRTADKGKTIAAEREWAFAQGEELWRAIREIEAI